MREPRWRVSRRTRCAALPSTVSTITYYRFDGSEEVRCYNIDATVMKTMLRAKNGLVVLRGGVIEAKYNCGSIDF